ncbi:EAL domain-containing protein [Marinomonas sp. 2405UD66-6]|uniref:sensor domain-containing protein n=1 Tax=Marinomonas sp. 2405UD66-6 TaxID=3391834 RepID=UPI0039C9C50A
MLDYLAIPCIVTTGAFQIVEVNETARKVFGANLLDARLAHRPKLLTHLIVSDLSAFYYWVESDDPHKTAFLIELQTEKGVQKFQVNHSQHTVDSEPRFFFSFSTVTYEMETGLQSEMYRNAFERSNKSLYVTDANGRILLVNPSFTHFFGLDLTSVKGKKDDILYYREDQLTHRNAIERLIHDVDRITERMHCVTSYKDLGPVICNVNIVMAGEGESRTFMHFIEDISHQVATEESMHSAAYQDPLTKLPNRHSFNVRFHEWFTEAQRTGDSLNVFFIDLDRFKFVNDEYGHEYGDLLLIHVAERLKKSCKERDFVARLAGDEFVVLVQDNQTRSNLEVIAQRILFELSKPFELNEIVYSCTCCIGIAQYPNDAMSQSDLLHAADSAMYLAKGSGRNDYAFYNYEMQKEVTHHDHRMKEIEHAIENNLIRLYFQPIHDLKTGEVVSFEALPRYIDESGEVHSDEYFMPYIENDPLIYKLGVGHIRVLKQFVSMLKHHGVQLPMHINLSSYQLKDKSIVAELEKLATFSPEIVRLLRLEVIETMLENSDKVARNLDHLNSLGYRLSLDDFGTGHSSIYSLKKVKFETVKIDRVFTQDIDVAGDQGAEYLNAVIALVRNLNKTIICNGVDNQKQASYLLEQGCQYGQGAFFSEPLSKSQVLRYLNA